MQIGVLAAPQSWYLRDLQRAAGDAHSITPLAFSALAATVEGDRPRVNSSDHDLRRFDAILVRSMPPGSLEQVIFRMNALHRLAAQGVLVINPPRSLELAVDKYLTSALLHAAGIPTPRTLVSQTHETALVHFHELGGDVVIKPLFGGEGRGITRIHDEAIAERVFRTLTQLGHVIYQQPFIDHPGYDVRVLLMGPQKSWTIRRSNPLDWRTNVSRGAHAEPIELDGDLVALAQHAADVVGAPVAGVDLLPTRTGEHLVLEVNAVPGWRGLGQATGCDVAAELLGWLDSLPRNMPFNPAQHLT